MTQILAVDQDILEQLAQDFVELLFCNPEVMVDLRHGLKDFYGFKKARLDAYNHQMLCGRRSVCTRAVQIEFVEVRGDLTRQIHWHNPANAYVVVLDEACRVRPPANAKMFFHRIPDGRTPDQLRPTEVQEILAKADRCWANVDPGLAYHIPAGALHGFTIEPDAQGYMAFVSVQSPPIDDQAEHNDYHNLFALAKSHEIGI